MQIRLGLSVSKILLASIQLINHFHIKFDQKHTMFSALLAVITFVVAVCSAALFEIAMGDLADHDGCSAAFIGRACEEVCPFVMQSREANGPDIM